MATNSLEFALNSLRQLRRNSVLAMALTIPFASLAFWAFGQFDSHWYKDPFILSIAVVFGVGQVASLVQHRILLRGARKTSQVLHALADLPSEGYNSMAEKLRGLPDGHFRDLILRIARPLQSGDTALAQNLLDSAANRRTLHENRRLGQHATINRTILKLGFLGTLIGLLLTFPPMKEAMMSLRDSGGELKFVNHIASALDGDRFAIFATLIATGLSLLIEIITFQMLERGFGRFEVMNSLAEEWVLASAAPAQSRNPAEWDGDTIKLQTQMHRNLVELADVVRVATRRIDDVREMQMSLEHRMERIHDLNKEPRA